MTWIVYALLAAVFAALVAVFAKIGLGKVDSNLATAIRTLVLVPVLWGLVFATGKHKGLANIDHRALVFLVLSALATGASWLLYFRALSLGPATAVSALDKLSVAIVFILAVTILGEAFTWKAALGVSLVAAGCVVMVWK